MQAQLSNTRAFPSVAPPRKTGRGRIYTNVYLAKSIQDEVGVCQHKFCAHLKITRKQVILTETGHILRERTSILRRTIHDGNGTTRNTDEFVVFVCDAYVPDMGGATTLYGCSRCGQLTIAFGPQVIGVDL